jgi:hypothetical protein
VIGYERTSPAPADVRTVGSRQIVVGVIGTGACGMWGYTIWEGDRCIAGARSADWQDVEAARRGELMLRALDDRVILVLGGK